MGWTSAPFTPLGWHPCAVNDLHNTCSSPTLIYPKCQSTWNTCCVWSSSYLCLCVFLPLSLKLARTIATALKLIPPTILVVRHFYHPFLPDEKSQASRMTQVTHPRWLHGSLVTELGLNPTLNDSGAHF